MFEKKQLLLDNQCFIFYDETKLMYETIVLTEKNIYLHGVIKLYLHPEEVKNIRKEFFMLYAHVLDKYKALKGIQHKK